MITLITFEFFYFEVLAPHGIAKFQISMSNTSISLELVLAFIQYADNLSDFNRTKVRTLYDTFRFLIIVLVLGTAFRDAEAYACPV